MKMGPGNGWTGRTTRQASSECVRPRGSAPPSMVHHSSLAGPRGWGVHGWTQGLRRWGPHLFGLFRNWAPEQPDDWYGHGLGGGEDCAHFTEDGRWNDDVCLRPYRWVCEAPRDRGDDS